MPKSKDNIDTVHSQLAWQKQESLRKAEVAFITDRQRHPAEYWWDKICVDIPLPTFLKRVRAGKWIRRRENYWDGVTQEILKVSKYRAVHDRVQEIVEIQNLRIDVLDAIQPKIVNGQKIYPVAPSTLEGMINAFTKIDALLDSKRDVVLTMIEPELAARGEADVSSITISPGEMRDVARFLLERKREQQMKRIGEFDDGRKTNE